MVRAKFRLTNYETQLDGSSEGNEVRTLNLSPVVDGSQENKEFYRWTPSGHIKLGVLNKKAWEQFEIGKEYYVDFTPVEVPSK